MERNILFKIRMIDNSTGTENDIVNSHRNRLISSYLNLQSSKAKDQSNRINNI